MTHPTICWGHNPGQRFVKDAIDSKGKRKDLIPYPAVIAPWAASDDTGLAANTRDLTATIGEKRYIGGSAAERLPLQNRQQDRARLDPQSPLYEAFAQMSAQHAGLSGKTNGSRPHVIIATALPVAWRMDDATASAQLEAKIKRALGAALHVTAVYVQSEPNALVASELLDDDGQQRADAVALLDVVCVGDIGGGTANRTVLERLRAIPGQAASPDLGSSQVVAALMQRSGMAYVDAERRLEAAARQGGKDAAADALLSQYREAVVSSFQEAWKPFRHAQKLFGGGTVLWVADDLKRAFGAQCRVVAKPQQAIAVGLYRYARRKAVRP